MMATTAEQGTADVNAGSDVVAAADRGARVLSVNHVVAVAVALGAATVTLAFAFGDTHAGAFQIGWLDGLWLVFVLAAVTCAAELVAVRMRHDDDAVEELTLLDGVVLLNTLVLPIRQALIVTLAGILLAYIVRRRDPLKMLYNMGVYASASSATAFLVHWIMPPEGVFDFRLVVAMTVATAAFVVVNLGHMVVLLGAIADARPWEVVREDAPLSLLTIIGTVGVTGTVLAMSVAAPVLLPCSVLPAVALRYAYGASAARHDERRRSARVLEYSQVLASGPTREVALAAFLHMVRQEFDAAASLVLFADGSGFQVDDSSPDPQPVTAELRQFIDDPRLRIVETADLPLGWHSAMTAPVVVEGRPSGSAVVATTGSARLQSRDLTTLSSLVGSFAVAVQNADHMVRLVEETSKLRAVVDQASDGIIVLGQHGVIEVWSPAMALLTGVSSADAIGTNIRDVIAVEDVENHRIDPFAEGERGLSPELPHCTVDADVIRADGERRATRFAHAGVFDGRLLVRDVVIVRDLTAERQVQRMKSDFIATVSHELRTPLTPIKGYAAMLRKRGDTMPPEKRQRALDVIVDRADHLGRLVEDLLAASTITANQEPTHSLATDSVDLATLVGVACDDFPGASSRLHLAPVSAPVPVFCDPTRVVQITSNLISNALKYSPEDRPVYVAVDKLEDRGRVTVTDQGQGIAADQLDRIFEKFHRVEDPMVMSTSGTGLGLFIARQLAHAMHGELTVASTLGVGSRFTLTLPSTVLENDHGERS
jgi:PAS domain S-box-containing protein